MRHAGAFVCSFAAMTQFPAASRLSGMTLSRRLVARTAAAALVVLTACSGESNPGVTPPSPPPPPPAPVATTVAVASGDAQQADIGTPVALRPTVVVRDAAGNAMSGVSVAFAVDSGGGSLTASAATTGADGTASSGSWTLGANVGSNVVTATVAGLPVVRFRALGLLPRTRTLVDTMAIAAGGGTVQYVKAGDPLSGLSLTVPANSYAARTTWSIRADSTIAVTLPPDFSQVGPVLVITNGQGYADSVITLTTPMRVDASDVVAPFYYDGASRTFEPIPLVARTDSSATLATRHFSSDMLALPGNAPIGSALRASRLLKFGSVQVVWIRVPRTRLVGNFTSSFRPGIDNWEFTNFGDYIAPNGDCEGMSITAMYYHYFYRASGKPQLFGQYDKSALNQWDNVQGIRFAGSVQGDYSARWYAGINQLFALVDEGVRRGTNVEELTSTWIVFTLKLNQRPVLVHLRNAAGGHVVVAYAASSNGTKTDISFADPNYPSTPRVMTFQSGLLSPVTLQQNAAVTPAAYNRAYALAVSAEVPMDQLSRRWVEFTRKSAGSDRYPGAYHHEVYDALTDSWSKLQDTVRTTASSLVLRFICPGCPLKTEGGATDEQATEIWNGDGNEQLAENGIKVQPGSERLLAVGKAYANFDPIAGRPPGFVDAKPFVVIAQPFKIAAEFDHAPPTVDLDFIAAPGGLGGTAPRYRWDFGDGTPPVVKTSESTVTHRWARYGNYTVKVELRTASGTLVARDSMRIAINNRAAYSWDIDVATVQSATLPPEGIGNTRADTLIYQKASGWMARLANGSSTTSLLLIGRATAGLSCNGVLYLHESTANTVPDTVTLDGLRGVIGNCGDPDYTGSLSIAPKARGSLTGQAVPVQQEDLLVLPGGSINALNTRRGAELGTLTGTFVVNFRYSTGVGTYRIAFSASSLVEIESP